MPAGYNRTLRLVMVASMLSLGIHLQRDQSMPEKFRYLCQVIMFPHLLRIQHPSLVLQNECIGLHINGHPTYWNVLPLSELDKACHAKQSSLSVVITVLETINSSTGAETAGTGAHIQVETRRKARAPMVSRCGLHMFDTYHNLKRISRRGEGHLAGVIFPGKQFDILWNESFEVLYRAYIWNLTELILETDCFD